MLGYLVLYVAIHPIVSPFTDLLDLAFRSDGVSNSQEFKSIFDQNQTSSTSVEPGSPEGGPTASLNVSDIQLPTYGTHFGKLTVEGTNINAPLFYGDGNKELKNGVGVYIGSMLPGYGSTTLVGGHNNTFFHDLGSAQVGAKITLQTNYGTYVYEVTETKVAKESDKTAYDLTATEDNLVLYTCYPFNTLGLTPDRYFVYAKYVSGPRINIYG